MVEPHIHRIELDIKNKRTFRSVGENSSTDSYVSLQDVGKTLLGDRKTHNRGDNITFIVMLINIMWI